MLSINERIWGESWILLCFSRKKKTKHGKLDKFKCRLVAKGYTQRPNIDNYETFSPAARMKTLRILLKVSVDRDHRRISIDFKKAFLNATLNEELYLFSIKGIDCPPGSIFKLNKAIYGLKQIGRSWFTILAEFLIMQGLKQCVSDPCVFISKDGNMMVIVYGADLIISTLKDEDGETIIKKIEKVFEIGDKGSIDWYLGIAFDDQGDSVRMSKKDSVEKMLLNYQIDSNHIEDTPISDKIKLVRDENDALFSDFDLKGKVGSLMYLAVCTRPDIYFAISSIARMSDHPSESVCKAMNHLFAYQNKNRDLGLLVKKETNSEMVSQSDSDYASDLNDFKSTLEITVFLGLLIECWYSSKQLTTVKSSTDAVAIPMNLVTKEVVWILGFLNE